VFIERVGRGASRGAASLKLDDALLQQALLYSGPFPRSTEGLPPLRFDFALTGQSTLWDYIGQGAPWAGWYPVKPVPLGKRKRREGWTPEPARRAEARKNIKEQRQDALGLGYDEGCTTIIHVAGRHVAERPAPFLKAWRPTWWNDREAWLMKPLPRVYRGKVGLRLLKTTNIKGVKDDIEVGTLVPEAPPIAAPPFVELAARIMRKAMSTLNFDVDPDLQDKIIKLHKKDLPPEAILDAVRKVGFEVDLDYVMNAIGTDGQTFGDGRDLPLVDDDKADAAREKEALNTNTMRGAPDPSAARGASRRRRPSRPLRVADRVPSVHPRGRSSPCCASRPRRVFTFLGLSR
jgi:hypothetical protein